MPQTFMGRNYYNEPEQMTGEDYFPSRSVQREFGEAFQPRRSISDWRLDEPDDDAGRYYADVQKAYAQTPALSAYRQHLKQQPNAEDYRPDVWTRVAAGLSGMSAGFKDAGKGIQVAQHLNQSKYRNALDEYYAQAAPLKEAASLERQGIDDMVGHIMKANELGLEYDDYRRQLANDQFNQQAKTEEIGIARGGLRNQEQQTRNAYSLGTSRLANDQRNTNSLIDFRGVQGKALTQQANTGAYNAQTNRMGTESLIDYRSDQATNNMIRNGIDFMKAQQGGAPTPGGLSTAQQDVLAELDPYYPDSMLKFDDTQGKYILGEMPEVGSPEYQDFLQMQQEIVTRTNNRARTGQASPPRSPGNSKYTVNPSQ